MSTQHYYSSEPHSESNPKSVRFTWQDRLFTFWTDAGVFSRDGVDKGSRILLSALSERISGSVLDLGCGWGAMGIVIAALHPGANVTLADINPRAVALARRNADVNKVRAQAVISDGFERLTDNYDLIVFNPPIRAGKATVYRLFEDCTQHLVQDGVLWIVIRKQQGAESALKYLRSIFADVAVVERSGGYWVIRCTGGKNHEL